MTNHVRGSMLGIPLACAALLYARFFSGYWLGDDFGNLQTGWLAAQGGETLADAWRQIAAPVPSEGAFYRPAMIAGVLINASLAGTRFAGWFAVNYAIHLANVALVAVAVATLARACGRDGRVAAVIAACLFAASPLIAEGVFWLSARADSAVTLLTFAAMLAWVRAQTSIGAACAVPLLVLAALGFKESAAVFPLQLALVAFAWPTRPTRAQMASVVGCFVAAALFFAMRAHLFGDIWHVYRAGSADSPGIRHAIASLLPWWRGLARGMPGAGTVYVALLSVAAVAALLATRGAQRLLAAALFTAAIGLCAATLLNLGGMNPSGEGGRLAYTPFAWLALALGVATAAPVAGAGRTAASISRRAGIAGLAAATIVGGVVLDRELRDARAAQDQMRALVQAVREWAALHGGLTLLIVDGERGPIVTGRNAHGGLVLPPLQPEPLLHRILPTLPAEIGLRYDQLQHGLATRLDALRPSLVDAATMQRLTARDAARWPEHYGCWSARERRIVELPVPDPGQRNTWATTLRDSAARCATSG
jgi:hypothetical protein